MTHEAILSKLPYGPSFLFVDELLRVNDREAMGRFTFAGDMDFYQGHFKELPVTPGVILTECCAQIGLVCLGIFLLGTGGEDYGNLQIAMSSSEMEFLLPVYPNEAVTVASEKIYFRFGKLKCSVKMHNAKGKLVCKGILSGMIKTDGNG
tara:strand:+ start:1479 stop:1928 length:450 start_codon:yes stop_codon:yes gene_type:complete